MRDDLKSCEILRFAQDFGAARMPRRHLNLLKRFARSKLEILHHKEVLAPYTTWGGEDEWVGLFFLRLESFLA